MLALILIPLGALIALVGLALIAPQVQVHQIDAISWPAWVFRGGALALLIGQLVGLTSQLDSAIVTVSLIMGIAILFAGLAIISHERQQAAFQIGRSLSLQILGTGLFILILALILR